MECRPRAILRHSKSGPFTPGSTWVQSLSQNSPNLAQIWALLGLKEADQTNRSSLFMTDRWQQVEKLCQSALELEERQRRAFLEEACAGDEELRREVESLLQFDRRGERFIEQPAVEVAAKMIAHEKPESLIGQGIGSYQILALLGAGGMGVVYKARDTRLSRSVAIKVLPPDRMGDPERKRRFIQEARAASALNHPNIITIYDIGNESGIDFIVMECVEGKTLDQRIPRKGMRLNEALKVAIQIADALAKAHSAGIIHRDLKPTNVMVTNNGLVKVLDFGLAKLTEVEYDEGETRTTQLQTEEGTIIGTVAYMSPEQAEGKKVDARSDIFSFGAVLYEMVTGMRAFVGDSNLALLTAIMREEPKPISQIVQGIPHDLEKIINRCLRKDPQKRLQAIGDARIEIEECLSSLAGPSRAEIAGLKPVAKAPRREQVAWAVAVAFLISTIVVAMSYLRVVRDPARTIISEILPPEKTQFSFQYGRRVLSPDGRNLAFSATDENGKTMLWVRALDSPSARQLPGTEMADMPFWSEDGRALGFFADGKLKTIEVSAGPAIVLADAPTGMGGSWNRNGTILFVPVPGKGVYQVAAAGGTPVTVLDLDASKYWVYGTPRFLPDGRHFLYSASASDPALSGTYFASLDGKENRLLLREGGRTTYASGFLLYVREATLVAQSFDPERGQLKGDPHLVAEQVAETFDPFDTSENGVLVYQGGGSGGARRFRWFDRTGKELGVMGEASDYWDLRLSPDGAKLAFTAGWLSDIWVDELRRGVRMRLTNDPGTDKFGPVWSPDGNRILFGAIQGKARLGIYQKLSNAVGGEELLLSAETPGPQIWPTSWSRDGKFILYSRGDVHGLTHAEIWVLPLAGAGKPRLFVKAPAYDGEFSPDGRWVAYTSKESDREEVYVVPFEAARVLNTTPGSANSPSGGKLQISSGGRFPRWRRDGKEIFYLGPGSQMMAAEVEAWGNSFQARKAQPLFRAALQFPYSSPYDVTPDGKRFVMYTVSNPNTPLTLVVNWPARLVNKP